MSAKVTFKRPSLEMELEVGSLSELAGYITDEGSTLVKVFGSDMSLVVKSLGGSTEGAEVVAITASPGDERPTFHTAETTAAAVTVDKPKGTRGRPKKNPEAAVAPAPIEVPAAPVEAPAVETAPEAPSAAWAKQDALTDTVKDDGIPAFLKNQDAPVAPPAPPPPPPAPVAPPSGILAGKIIAKTDEYKSAGKEEMILNWLIGTGIAQQGSTYDEVVSVIRLQPDAKLGAIATALSIS